MGTTLDTSKGESTHRAIVEHAVALASQIGYEALTIGRLADDIGLSKSGLFAHFKSKEELQAQVVEAAQSRFTEEVVKPGLQAPRGEPRLRKLVELWIRWVVDSPYPGGCPLVAGAFELDDQPGRVRERIASGYREMSWLLAGTARMGVEAGHFRADLDPDQLAFDIYALLLSACMFKRLLRDPKASARVLRSFDALLEQARPRSSNR
jgi:AcrR family transcriptional regulator